MDKRKLLLIGLALVLMTALAVGCGQAPPANGNGDPAPGIDALELANVITAEWADSRKQFAMSVPAGRSAANCGECHDGYGFANKNEIDFVAQWNPGGVNEDMDAFPEHLTGISCQACHTGAGLAYVESGTVELPYGVIDNAGKGALCMYCHSGRRNTEAAFAEYAAGDATRFTYPHYGPASVFTGQGGMEYPDMEYRSSAAHATISDSCVTCHMPETADGYKAHGFAMDLAYIDQTCGTCHSGISDYNLNGFVDEIQEKLDLLKAAVSEATGAVDITSGGGQLVFVGPDGQPLSVEDVSLEAFVAGYNYYEIKYEGSYGIHNPAYARSLLENAYKALTGEDM